MEDMQVIFQQANFDQLFKAEEELLDWFQAEFLNKYTNVLYHVIVELTNTFTSARDTPIGSSDVFARRCYQWLQRIMESRVLLEECGVTEWREEGEIPSWLSSLSSSNAWKRPSNLSKKYVKLWEAFLGAIELPEDIHKSVLRTINTHLIGRETLRNPFWLMDFFERAFSSGGIVAIVALQGMFSLVTKYNFSDLPHYSPDDKFYPRIYALLQPWVFYSTHRARFFVLLDKCLCSTHLPSYIPGAFAKRLARLCLTAPPHGILTSLALIYNILLRFPATRVLLHRPIINKRAVLLLTSQQLAASMIAANKASNSTSKTQTKKQKKKKKRKKNKKKVQTEITKKNTEEFIIEDEELEAFIHTLQNTKQYAGADPFLMKQLDFEQCRAMESSLWEIETLKRHYHPPVVQQTYIFDGIFKKQPMDMSAFAQVSYLSEVHSELSRKKKRKQVALEFRKPKGLFTSDWDTDFVSVWPGLKNETNE